MSLIVNEIFFSIQGESTRAGFPCAFVRLTGCNLRCSYCDTRYAYDEGQEMAQDEILRAVAAYPAQLVEVTGGEPLLQAETPQLIAAFADREYTILLETNGSLPLLSLDKRAIIIMDIKCPGSGMSEHMNWNNIAHLKHNDEVKFVIGSRGDFDWSIDIIREHKLNERVSVALSPAFGLLEPRELAEWILQTPLQMARNIRLQLQLHKIIWPHAERGV